MASRRRGPAHPPAVADADGHFDHIELGTPQFEAAHFYATTRFVLDIWEGYFARPIDWDFGGARLELVITPRFRNAIMGYGFIEAGGYTTELGEYRPFSLNFDILAHETGHGIIYPQMGLPTRFAQSEFHGFHESVADLVALLSALHLQSVIDDLFETTRGNLYALNKLNRIGELSNKDQIRFAANIVTLSAFADGWTDEHDLGQPLTGAMFDTLVDVFHELALERGLIDEETEALSDALEFQPGYEEAMQWRFDQAYDRDPDGFEAALLDARDILGTYLAASLEMLSPDDLTYVRVLEALLEIDRQVTGGAFGSILSGNFAAREIGLVRVGPKLAPRPPVRAAARPRSYREQRAMAHAQRHAFG